MNDLTQRSAISGGLLNVGNTGKVLTHEKPWYIVLPRVLPTPLTNPSAKTLEFVQGRNLLYFKNPSLSCEVRRSEQTQHASGVVFLQVLEQPPALFGIGG
ncbi:hypothetical protein, partial [Pseudomonas nitroreducens]|uniref:hypothetical protein n=1 Tax=Pseudomonas nitroreducens TaxID=46680 RepID=UPI001A8F478D